MKKKKESTPVHYQQGKEAFKRGRPDSACPYGATMLVQRGWWFAGFYDAERGLV